MVLDCTAAVLEMYVLDVTLLLIFGLDIELATNNDNMVMEANRPHAVHAI